MVVNSFFSVSDQIDPTVTWIPREFYLGNFKQAFETLDFFKSFGISMLMSVVRAANSGLCFYCVWVGKV